MPASTMQGERLTSSRMFAQWSLHMKADQVGGNYMSISMRSSFAREGQP